jgi:low temperature requirement protein LtrA
VTVGPLDDHSAARRAPRPPVRRAMVARPIDEPHRVSSQLELLFDLTFVVGIAGITAQLVHGTADGHAVHGIVPFLQVFFAVRWAWMNFTWFASSFDTDDVPYRLLTMVQMAGVLVLAAGVPAAADHGDFRTITTGYLIMRTALVALWMRAATEDPERRLTARRYALGIAVAEVGWIARQVLDEAGLLPAGWARPVFLGLVVFELLVPAWAERIQATTWHSHHIAERYGLFAIILLGEGILAASTGVEQVVAADRLDAAFLTIAVSGLVLVFALWWLYFLEPCGELLAAHRERSWRWGYGHYGVFASLVAFGGGLEVAELHFRPRDGRLAERGGLRHGDPRRRVLDLPLGGQRRRPRQPARSPGADHGCRGGGARAATRHAGRRRRHRARWHRSGLRGTGRRGTAQAVTRSSGATSGRRGGLSAFNRWVRSSRSARRVAPTTALTS